MSKSILVFLLALFSSVCFMKVNAQRSEKLSANFTNVDGFSGYVTFTVAYRQGPGTAILRGGKASLVITGWDKLSLDEKTILEQNGIDLYRGYQVNSFGFTVEGQATIRSAGVSYMGFDATTRSRLQLGNGSSEDFTTPSFGEDAKNANRKWLEKNKTTLWEDWGDFKDLRIISLSVSDFKNEVAKVLNKHKNEQQQSFDRLVSNARSKADSYDFSEAESLLNQASAQVGSRENDLKVSSARSYINSKKEERKAEQERRKKPGRQSDANKKEDKRNGGDDKSKTGSEKEKQSQKKETTDKPIIVKSSCQMYAEWKETLDKFPYKPSQKDLEILEDLRQKCQNERKRRGEFVYEPPKEFATVDAAHEAFNKLGEAAAAPLLDFFDMASGGFVAVQAKYATMGDFGKLYSLGMDYQGYWNVFSLSMTIGAGMIQGLEMWSPGGDYELPSNWSSNMLSKINDNQILFRDITRGGSEVRMTAKPYKRADKSFYMLFDIGTGFNIPFRHFKPIAMVTGFYNMSIGSLPSFYGYRFMAKVDLSHTVTLSAAYTTSFYSQDHFSPSYLKNPYANRTLQDLENLKKNNNDRKIKGVEFTLGIKIIDNSGW